MSFVPLLQTVSTTDTTHKKKLLSSCLYIVCNVVISKKRKFMKKVKKSCLPEDSDPDDLYKSLNDESIELSALSPAAELLKLSAAGMFASKTLFC